MRISLKILLKDGIEAVWRKHARYAAATRAAFEAIGLPIFPERPNNALTVARVPDGIDGSVLLAKLEKQYGLKLAGGQDELKGKIVRLTHMGYIDQFDILAAISGLEYVLAEMGAAVELGKGVATFQKMMSPAGR